VEGAKRKGELRGAMLKIIEKRFREVSASGGRTTFVPEHVAKIGLDGGQRPVDGGGWGVNVIDELGGNLGDQAFKEEEDVFLIYLSKEERGGGETITG